LGLFLIGVLLPLLLRGTNALLGHYPSVRGGVLFVTMRSVADAGWPAAPPEIHVVATVSLP